MLRYQAIKSKWTCCFKTAMHDYSFETRKKIWNENVQRKFYQLETWSLNSLILDAEPNVSKFVVSHFCFHERNFFSHNHIFEHGQRGKTSKFSTVFTLFSSSSRVIFTSRYIFSTDAWCWPDAGIQHEIWSITNHGVTAGYQSIGLCTLRTTSKDSFQKVRIGLKFCQVE